MQDMHGQLVGVRVIHGHELNPAFHKRRDKSVVPGEWVEVRAPWG